MTRRENPRRLFCRCNVELPVGFWSLSDAAAPGDYMKGETVDLSQGGVLVRCERFEDGFLQQLVEDGSMFAMRIHLPDHGGWVRTTAKVVWIEEEGGYLLVRACFVDVDEDSVAMIREVVARAATGLPSLDR